ncbi:hypothetical protein [Sphingomonas sp. ABOLF]|uniref:hypothetical protein n=1 Tax=Sphingomonas sp. ABOLF TaxID=1985879 RepID=UPI000F7E7CF6|nr:hypothetical protein [Sphingomonas sp. ABOLF]
MSAVELNTLLRQGASVVVSASQHNTAALATMARQLCGASVLHITDCSHLSSPDMNTIARQATEPASVLFSG